MRRRPSLLASRGVAMRKPAFYADQNSNRLVHTVANVNSRWPRGDRWGAGAIMLRGALLSCPICNLRKEKRFCPAVHGQICAQCCGEQREVTLDCPSDCPYLRQAREHEKPRPADHLDPKELFLQVEVPDQFMYEREHLLMGLTFALAKAARSDRTLNDRDLLSALSGL